MGEGVTVSSSSRRVVPIPRRDTSGAGPRRGSPPSVRRSPTGRRSQRSPPGRRRRRAPRLPPRQRAIDPITPASSTQTSVALAMAGPARRVRASTRGPRHHDDASAPGRRSRRCQPPRIRARRVPEVTGHPGSGRFLGGRESHSLHGIPHAVGDGLKRLGLTGGDPAVERVPHRPIQRPQSRPWAPAARPCQHG